MENYQEITMNIPSEVADKMLKNSGAALSIVEDLKHDISFTSEQKVQLINFMGNDNSIIDAARVSTGSPGSEKANLGLINMLMRDRHGSPFEQVTFTFYIETPIFVAREFFRHRMASYNEESGRYKQLEGKFYIPNEKRNLKQSGKPAQYTYHPGTVEEHRMVVSEMVQTSTNAYDAYQRMLDRGIAREVARQVLPLNLFTSFFVTMNARGLMNFLSLRKSEEDSLFATNPMAEINELAIMMGEVADKVIPLSMDAFERHGFVAP